MPPRIRTPEAKFVDDIVRRIRDRVGLSKSRTKSENLAISVLTVIVAGIEDEAERTRVVALFTLRFGDSVATAVKNRKH